MVRGEVTSAVGSWEFRDALFTPAEALRFADWLEQLETLAVGADFAFTEPEVRFERGRSTADGEVELRVYFAFKAAPPSTAPGSDDDTEVMLAVTKSAAVAAAADLRREVRALLEQT